jgi:LysR family transcriptional regulator (chromosome initiation inhibitor)
MKKNMALLNPHLEAFMAVAAHKTVHAGARAIHLSQTAMTQRIHSLEEKLKTSLFVRTRQGMLLTSEGEKLLRYCHTVATFSHETLTDMMNAGIESIQRVKISGPSSIMSSRIIPFGMKIMRQFPELYITFDVDDTDNTVTALRTGLSQFSILKTEQVTRDMESKMLAPEKYLLVCTRQWKGRKLNDILQSERIIDFDESDQASIHYLKQFDLLKQAQADRLFVNRTESLSKMLIEGYGYGVLTKEFSKPYLDNGDLITLNSGKILENFLTLAWYKRPEPPKYFLAMINAIV